MILIRIVSIVTLAFVLAGCKGGNEQSKEAGAAATQPAPTTNRVDIPPTVRKNLGITFAKVEKRRIGQTVRVPGHFELLPQARQEYRAILPGRVEFFVQQYQSIEAGTPLYRMQSPEWPEVQREMSEGLFAIEAARNDIAVEEATLKETETRIQLQRDRIAALAQAEVRRAELELQLAELNAALPRLGAEIKAKRSTLAAAEARLDLTLNRAAAILGTTRESLEETVPNNSHTGSGSGPRWQTIDWIEVKASQPGIVESIALTPGGWAETASLILTTANPRLVRFRGLGLQADLPRLRNGAPTLIIPPQGERGSLEPIAADLIIGLEADPSQRTVALLATPKAGANTEWARPGVSAFLEIETAGTGSEEMVIPRSAIVQDGLAHIIFRRDPANLDKVIRMDADLGLSDGRWTVVNSGVKVGDEIVLNGVYELKLATSGTAQKGGHIHADGTFHAEH